MTSKKQQSDPFFMVFPWGKVAGMLFLVVFGAMFIYRLSETGGAHVNQSCLFAMIVAGTAGITGIYAIGKTWGRDVHWVLIGIMIAAAIRLLIGGAGVAIITSFTNVHRSWFVLFMGIYYLGFLGVDTWFALWVLRNCELKDQEQRIHGNVWDMLS
ncbi:MAG: hypothetical protein ACYSOF_07975 [Planctomycetota bacterium]|jgi:hypothetical protein